jgi:hypothetical protein
LTTTMEERRERSRTKTPTTTASAANPAGHEGGVRPDEFFALSWTLYRLQLSAVETAAALWWASVWELWLPRKVARRARKGPSLAEMVRETREDTFQSDEGGTA